MGAPGPAAPGPFDLKELNQQYEKMKNNRCDEDKDCNNPNVCLESAIDTIRGRCVSEAKRKKELDKRKRERERDAREAAQPSELQEDIHKEISRRNRCYEKDCTNPNVCLESH